MKKSFYIIIMFVLPFMTSCRKFHSIEGNHQQETEVRAVSGYTEVSNSGDFELYLIQSPDFSVEVEAEKNLIPYIETEVSGNRLEVKVKNNRNLDNNLPMKIYISAPHYEKIRMSGSGKISCDTLDNDYIDFSVSGSGNISAISYSDNLNASISGSGYIYLNGAANNADLRISGSGRIKAYGMETTRCFCRISGSGNIYTHASDLLDVNISGSGSVYYRGYPQVAVTISGSGKVIHD